MEQIKALSDHKNANGWFSYPLESHILLWCEGVCEINRLNCCGAEKHTITSADSSAAQMESRSTLTVPMQGSLRCHFWHEPIISLSYCSFHFSAVVSLLFATSPWKMSQFLKCSLRTEKEEERRLTGGAVSEDAHLSGQMLFFFVTELWNTDREKEHSSASVYIIIWVINNISFSLYTCILIWQI